MVAAVETAGSAAATWGQLGVNSAIGRKVKILMCCSWLLSVSCKSKAMGHSKSWHVCFVIHECNACMQLKGHRINAPRYVVWVAARDAKPNMHAQPLLMVDFVFRPPVCPYMTCCCSRVHTWHCTCRLHTRLYHQPWTLTCPCIQNYSCPGPRKQHTYSVTCWPHHFGYGIFPQLFVLTVFLYEYLRYLLYT